MRFVIDAQLPPALARWLNKQGHDATHVSDHGMAASSDRDVWEFAYASDAVIVTKDEDFAIQRSLVANGPSIIWIRYGNVTRRELLTKLLPVFPAVLDALERGEVLVEVI